MRLALAFGHMTGYRLGKPAALFLGKTLLTLRFTVVTRGALKHLIFRTGASSEMNPTPWHRL